MTLKRKLTSNSGASMVLGLFFFFFCVAVGAIVLTAATANSGRVARLRQEDQNRLAAESAATLVQESLSTLTFQGSYTKHNWVEQIPYTETDDLGNTTTYYILVPGGPTYGALKLEQKGDPIWAEQLKEQLKTLYLSTAPKELSAGNTIVPFLPTPIQLTLSGEAMMGSQVSITLTLKKDYTIEVDLSRADAPEEEPAEGGPVAASAPPVGGVSQSDQFMYFTLIPVRTDAETSRTTPPMYYEDTYIDYLTTVTWKAGAIMKGVRTSEAPAP